MATNDCCNDDADCPDENACTKEGRKYFVAEVEEMNAPQCGEDAPCDFTTPYYDKTLTNTGFVIPEVGSTFIISVCDNNRWAIGQWVYIPNAGKFEITGKDGCRMLYLRNGCGTGDAAVATPGNAAPGKSFNGEQYFWLNINVECGEVEDSDYCNQVLDAIADCEQNLCKVLPDVDDEDTETEHRLLAGTYAEGDDSWLSCFFKAVQIAVTEFTLCFKNMPSNNQSKIEDVPVQDVQILPDGCLNKRALPVGGAIDRYCAGEKTYLEVPADYATQKYALGVDSDGCPAWVENCAGSVFKPAFKQVYNRQNVAYANDTSNVAYSNYPTQEELDEVCANAVFVWGRAAIDVKSEAVGEYPNLLLQIDDHNTCQQASQQNGLKVFDNGFFLHRTTGSTIKVELNKIATGFSSGKMSCSVEVVGFMLVKE